MIIKTISYGKTFNLGNYESERIDITVELDDADDPTDAFDQLRRDVNTQHKQIQASNERDRAAKW